MVLHRLRQAGECLAFDHTGAAGLRIEPSDSWQTIAARLPEGWQPDFLVLDLHYTSIPPALWAAPVPIVGLAADWDLLWHYYQRCLPRCDLILTDTLGAQVLARAGMGHAQVANLIGWDHSLLFREPAAVARDIDILCVGSLHPAIQRERLSWLTRLARLGQRWRVVIRTDAQGEEYRHLLSRARIVCQRSRRGEASSRVFEAAACGALVFQEADNSEVAAYFQDRSAYIAYTADNLEALLEHYLTHEDERRAIAAAARSRVAHYGFADCWDEKVRRLENEWSALQERAARRAAESDEAALLRRTWQMLSSNMRNDTTLVADLTAALALNPSSASLHQALGLATTVMRPRREWSSPPVAAAAAEHFRRAWQSDPGHVLAGLNLAEALACQGEQAQAIEQARRTLALLEGQPEPSIPARDAGHYPPFFDHFRVEWERAGWEHAGQPAAEARAKSALLHWRLHLLLAEWTGERGHAYEAALARPDLPPSAALVGRTLHRAGQHAEAVAPLRRAVAGNPLDRDSAHMLYETLGALQRKQEQGELVRDYRLLAQAAPQLVPRQDWFAEPESPSHPPAAPAASAARETFGIIWEGPQLHLHSYAHVNRELCRRLLERGHALCLLPPTSEENSAPTFAGTALLRQHFERPLPRPVEVHVCHQWPPRLVPPPSGHWVVMQPWEFGSLPRPWLDALKDQVDEIWAYSQYVRQCYVQSGFPAERVQVVPLGIDPARFQPGVRPLPLQTDKRFKFLFVGGTIHRKGIDVLLETYARAFTAHEDVCLVVKALGADSFYRGQSAISRRIADWGKRPDAPALEYIERPLEEDELACLYAACDCLVLPYRGEGFGLPIAEAMACGLPVIATGYGAALDYCDDSRAYLIPARLIRFAHKRVGALETVDYPWLAEPDGQRLQDLLRHVVAHRDEARRKGQAAAQYIHSHFTWEHTVAQVESRLASLRRQPPRRSGRLGGRPLAAPPVRVDSPQPGRPRVSLCMIVKDEADKLAECLASVADVVDEMVVVDTGSTDATREVALRSGARVVDFAWVEDFSAARNESVRQATGEWVFWLDADERLDGDNRRKLQALFRSLEDEPIAYVMRQLSAAGSGSALAVDQVRLFRRDPAVRWQYRVHEQILLSLRRAGYAVSWTDIVIGHAGYQDAEKSRRKLERNVRLLLLEQAERPDDPITLYHLGLAYSQQGRTEEALPLLQRSLELAPLDYSIRPKLYAMLGRGQQRLGRRGEALAACREGRRHYPEDVELLFLEALLREEEGDLAGAEACLLHLLDLPARPQFAAVDAGLRGAKARQLLAAIYRKQGRVEEAQLQAQLARAGKDRAH